MTATPCLFIGGHRDGKRFIVPDNVNNIQVPCPLDRTKEYSFQQIDNYRRFAFPSGSRMVSVFALATIPAEKVINELINKYPTNS